MVIPAAGTARALLARAERLPSLGVLAPVAAKLLPLLHSPSSSALDVQHVIARDQALTSKVLRVANSAYYGFPQRLATVGQAVVILGFNEIRKITMAAAMGNLLGRLGSASLDRFRLARHGLAAAAVADVLARRSEESQDEAFVAGLLHDLGKCLFDQIAPDEYAAVVLDVRSQGRPALEVEHERLGLDHAQLAAAALESWRLPAAVVMAVRYHHRPGQAERHPALAAVVHAADFLAHALGYGDGLADPAPVLLDDVRVLLRLDEHNILGVVRQIRRELERVRDFLDTILEGGEAGAATS